MELFQSLTPFLQHECLCYAMTMNYDQFRKLQAIFSKSFIVLLLPDQVAFHFIVNLAFYLPIILAKAHAQKYLTNSGFNHSSVQSFWNTR